MNPINEKTLRQSMPKHGIDGYIIPSTDEFCNEYVPKHLKRLKMITGFTGSNGVAIIMKDEAVFYTDGRYLTQARLQLSQEFKILDMYEKSSCEWFADNKGQTIGYDPMLHSEHNIRYYQRLASKFGFTLKAIDENLIDKLTDLSTIEGNNQAFMFDVKYAGLSSQDKIGQICRDITGDYLFLNNLDAICWLLNIRGTDIDYTPYVLSYLLLAKKDKQVTLFTNPDNKLGNNIAIKPFNELQSCVQELVKQRCTIQLDPKISPVWFCDNIPDEQLVRANDPCALPKACKNEVEIAGIREAHIQDGIALCKFLYWLENTDESKDELQAAEKLLQFRKERNLFQYPSFTSISAYAGNGAIIHYAPTPETNLSLGTDSLYLIDSGGQYFNGTTDVTRTICLSASPKQEYKKHFTLVLKAHIALARAKFKIGTTGGMLDIIARGPLWDQGLDYQHGTGHGVGHFSSVHEGPARISKSSDIPLQPNMVLSNEPGYYKEGEYGIRIENLVVVVESKYKGFLEFEALTLAPIDPKLIELSMLTCEEIEWLDSYNTKVLNEISPHLNSDEKVWLKGCSNTKL